MTVCPSPFPFAPDRTYASKYIPIIASVSEHKLPTRPSYFMDINLLAFLVPVGIENAIKLKYAEKKNIFSLKNRFAKCNSQKHPKTLGKQ